MTATSSDTKAAARATRDDRRCLIVGYDGGEGSRQAASWAASQLAPNGRLVLVHACRPLHAPPSPLSSAHERQVVGRALFDELLLEGEDALLATLVHTELSDADPVSALTEAASHHQATGIVVGHDRHSRLRTAAGTVTSELIGRAEVPVTVVPLGAAND